MRCGPASESGEVGDGRVEIPTLRRFAKSAAALSPVVDAARSVRLSSGLSSASCASFGASIGFRGFCGAPLNGCAVWLRRVGDCLVMRPISLRQSRAVFGLYGSLLERVSGFALCSAAYSATCSPRAVGTKSNRHSTKTTFASATSPSLNLIRLRIKTVSCQIM